MNSLQDKAIGTLMAAAVGDAIGGATEGRSAEEIRERYHGPVQGIVDYFMPDWRTAKPMSPYFKGDGHVTDDTLMTNLLIQVYDKRRRHLTAFDLAEDLVPLMMNQLTWIPELEREAVPILRVFLAEKWLVTRLHYGHVDPREAGVGNVVNCGAAMYMAPVGIANAGDPAGAYAEAADLAGAHQSSYGREAAAVFAAAVAAAMTPGISVGGVFDAVLGLARDGTRNAIEAVLTAADGMATGDWLGAIPVLRRAIAPFDSVGEVYREPAQDSRRPSRLRAIEELPVALGFLAVTDGDVRGSILGATNYGRDSDSIATMGGAIAGALGGEAAVPADWAQTVATNSKLDLHRGGLVMAQVAQEIHAADSAAADRRGTAFAALIGADTTGSAVDVDGGERGVKRVTWVQPEDLVRHELRQSADEGRDVAAIRQAWVAAGYTVEPPVGGVSSEPAGPAEQALAERLLAELADLPDPSAADEPSDWPAILAALPAGAADPSDDAARRNLDPRRVKGAWVGRAVGCVLGKPVEKVPRAGIEEILRSTGRWPLRRYFTAVGLDPQVGERWPWNRASRPTSLEENIDGTPEDDDLNYTLMALRTLEQHGADFDAGDVATGWLLDLPAGRAFTAERVAYRNLLSGIEPPRTAVVGNPFREWIGAQIRTDLYGWVNPGNPRRAAEFAWRDACVSHTRNGLYGAMFVAAMASAAIDTDASGPAAVERVLDVGASVVPPASRMAAAIALGRELGAAGGDPRTAYAALEAEFADLHWVHALNNSALVAYALTAARGSFDEAIGLTVTGGWDTDSNGATVGAVMGALVGADGIDRYWSDPLQGKVSSSIPGCDGATFDELADRTIAVARRVRSSPGANLP